MISSSLRAELSTSRNHYAGKVSAFADGSSNSSHPLTGCQRYCGRRRLLRRRPLPQCLFGRGSFIHASQALRPEKRGSPLPMGRTGTDSIALPLHCVRTRPAGKEVRLRLDFFDARFILSGSVLHFVPDTSSEGGRRRETVTDGVPLLSTPSLPDSQSGIATLSLRSMSCQAYMLQGLQLRYGCGIKPWLLLLAARQIQNRVLICSRSLRRFPPTAPSPFWSRLRSRLQSLCLHSVTQAPSAGQAHTSEVRCRSVLIQPSVPECNMQYGSPCFFAKLIPCFIHWRDSSSGVLF